MLKSDIIYVKSPTGKCYSIDNHMNIKGFQPENSMDLKDIALVTPATSGLSLDDAGSNFDANFDATADFITGTESEEFIESSSNFSHRPDLDITHTVNA